MTKMKYEDIKIPGEFTIINGEKSENDITMFTLSTCQWCAKGKEWFKVNNYSYRFLDVDLLSLEDKRKLKRDLMNVFGMMVRYPFLVIDGKISFAGFNIDKWKELLKIGVE